MAITETMDSTLASSASDSILESGEPLASVFEERAENLSRSELFAWTTETPRDKELIAKLKNPGQKLLSGPRGSGKSTLLRRAYFDLLENKTVLPVYVNYARSLALEPLFHHKANALTIFRQWVLLKIVEGLNRSFEELNAPTPADLAKWAKVAAAFIHSVETQQEQPPLEAALSPSELLLQIEAWTDAANFRRCVLFLDDAAHAFSPEQQREFFEIFRELRSRIVSAKAAVYPGITSYSPHFHVGHEAELLEAWYQPDDLEYLEIMRAMVKKRLPSTIYRRIEGKEELVDYLALASFGLPRGFLLMLSQVLGIEEAESSKPSVAKAQKAVTAYAESVRGLFQALSKKLPRLNNLINMGVALERSAIESLREFNRGPRTRKAVVFGIKEPLEPELDRILSLQEYAGIVRRLEMVSRGEKGRFRRFSLHYALLLTDNALGLGKSASIKTTVDALSQRDAHAFVRTQGTSLLGPDFRRHCSLDLAPCRRCGTPRLSEDARFCMKCGAELVETSVYEQLLQTPIDQLPLTAKKIDGLKRFTKIRTVQDVLLDEDCTQIRRVPHIGPVWAARIRNSAEEFVSV